MGTQTARERLLGERKITDSVHTNGETKGAATPVYLTGEKLKEAAGYLTSARACLLKWSREACMGTDRMETDAEHIHEVLGIAVLLETKVNTLKFKARLYGANGV